MFVIKYLYEERIMGTRPFLEPKLTKQEKLIIDAQNELVLDLFSDTFYMKPEAITRDSKGHIYVFTSLPAKMEMYTFGINTNESALSPFCVGRIIFSECEFTDEDINEEEGLFISHLSIYPSFQSIGLGKLLLQNFENFALEWGCKSIFLESYTTYRDQSRKETPHTLIEKSWLNQMTDKEIEEYIKNNFIDTNRKFYQSCGYVGHTRKLKEFVPMKKTNLENFCLNYGLIRNPEMRIINNENKIKQQNGCYLKAAINYAGNSRLFSFDNTVFPSEQFAPLKFDPTVESLEDLFTIITHLNALPLYKQQHSNSDFYAHTKFCELSGSTHELAMYLKSVTNSFSSIKNPEKICKIYHEYLEKLSKFNEK